MPAGESGRIAPAGEMWSVVIESPTFTRILAPSIRLPSAEASPTGPARSSKNGGSRTYVESGSHSYAGPVGVGSAAQRSSPSQIRPYWSVN